MIEIDPIADCRCGKYPMVAVRIFNDTYGVRCHACGEECVGRDFAEEVRRWNGWAGVLRGKR